MTVMFVNAKVGDMLNLTVGDIEYAGYVPKCTLGHGDYIRFAVDVETGQIIGWKNPLEDIQFIEHVEGR